MLIFFLISLFVFGLLFGSFSSVIIYRIKSGEGGILTGRSHCGSCNNILKIIDLIPLVSWVLNWGKCRQCKAKISLLYPILELSMGALFVFIGYFLIDYNLIFSGDFGENLKLFFWLLIGFISIIYIFYDILFLEISERILASGIGLALVGIIIQSYSSIQVFPSLPLGPSGDLLSLNHSVGLLILTIIGLYTIILKNLSEIWDILILVGLFLLLFLFNTFFTSNFNLTEFPAISAAIGVLSIFTFFFIQIVVSKGRWMGGGDLRIAILVGLILGSTLAFPGMMLTYFAGSVIGIGFLIYQRVKKGKDTTNSISTQIPFGPFIAIGFFLSVFFQEKIIYFMDIYLLV